jgi:hypothetical protein
MPSSLANVAFSTGDSLKTIAFAKDGNKHFVGRPEENPKP